ncbi:MAG: GTP cyclohydrolase II [Saprospiraceae bacterium]|jgi:GTP cyclohydrolase II|nr:GTP cyclohydrolase II [Saprospiraceae bacterium]
MKKEAEVMIPTKWGHFKMIAYANATDERMPHYAMVHESFAPKGPIFVRIHSECVTGDIWGSKRCDCGAQLDEAMQIAAQHGGVVIYLRQEGRGIGIINKLKAYSLQDQGMDTIDANLHLGFEADERSYHEAIFILKDLGITELMLMTNNPIKLDAFNDSGIRVIERVPLIIKPDNDNEKYLRTKQELMGHMLNMK